MAEDRNGRVVPIWMGVVEDAVAKYKNVSPEEQEVICEGIKEEYGHEAKVKARELFGLRAKPKPVEKPKVDFAAEEPKADDEPVVLSKAAPYDSAKEFVRRNCFKDGVLATYWWNGEFWEWNGRCYGKVSDAKINSEVWAFLDGARTGLGPDSNRFRPRPADVEGVMKGLKAGLGLNVDPPCWLDGRGKADGVLVFKNGIVDIKTGKLMGLDARLWAHHALEFEYDPEAKCPVWDRFLGEVFEGDPESRDCIEEQLGLGMTEDVRFHKGFLWIGRKGREGKGTLAHVLEKLCGGTGYVSLSFHSWLKGDYSKEVLIGKRVGVFPDVRFKPGKWYGQNFDAGGIDHVSKEMLLKITGGDDDTVGRKYNPVAWRGVLPIKVFLISNDIPNLNDPILVTRFVKIAFNISFRDREDLTLGDRLKAELPGIANRCLAGYRRLCGRGSFIQPQSGLQLAKEIATKSNPYQAFVEDRCVLDAEGMVQCTVLFFAFQDWCRENGRLDLLRTVTGPNQLSSVLRKEVPELENLKLVRPNGQQRRYVGIRLKTKVELEGNDLRELVKLEVEGKKKVVVVGKFRRRI
jgi:putative DNA primase/helicase